LIELLNNIIKGQCEKLGIDKVEKINFMKVGSRNNLYSSVSFLVFINKLESPTLAVKLSYTVDFDKILRYEFENLTYLHDNIKNEAVKQTIPLPLFFSKLQGYPFLIESALDGKLMVYIAKKKMDECFRLASKWLVAFGKETVTKRVKVGGSFFKRFLDEITVSFLSKLDPLNRDQMQKYFDVLGSQFSRFSEETLPITCVHGDFDPYNVIVKRNNACVVDWENCQRESIPLLDLIRFPLYAGVFISDRNEQRFVENYIGEGNFKALTDKYIQTYCDKMDISYDLSTLFTPFCVASIANQEMGFSRRNEKAFYMWIKILNCLLKNNDLIVNTL